MASSQMPFAVPAVERPTIEQLQVIAGRLHLHLSPSDLVQYKDQIDHMLGSYDRVEKMVEPVTLSKYPTTAGLPPSPALNPYNAWARLTNIAGSETGKLAGKKIAIKDNVHISGVPMANGSHFFRGFVSSYSATVVDRILDEGGVIEGKATCENMCVSGSSFSSASGPVLNPYDKTRSAGGSSSGCAVLVAIGEVDLAVGTDQGGSVRMPSCCCGIVGLKPTFGLVPYTGVVSLDANLDHVGPMARTVNECALLLEVMAGCDGLDPRQQTSQPLINYSEQLTGDVSGLRVGLLKEGFEGSESDVDAIVRSAAMSLKQLGVSVKELSFPLHNQAGDVASIFFTEGSYDTYFNGGVTPLNTSGFKDTVTQDFMVNAAKSRADSMPVTLKSALLMSTFTRETYGSRFYSKAINVRRAINEAYDELFKEYDVIIMPTIKIKPHLLLSSGASISEYSAKAFENTPNTFPYNMTGHPALSINAGFSVSEPRLPVGMMMVGRHFDDVTILRLAHAYEGLRDQLSDYSAVSAQLASTFKSRAN